MIEKTQKSSNISATLEYLEKGNESSKSTSATMQYLDKSDNKQIRELYSTNGKKIDADTGVKISKMFQSYEVKIYNPKTDNVSLEELHHMAKEIISARSQHANEKLGAVYAVHYRPDGTNKHLHISFFGSKQALEKSGKGRNWINALDKIELNYTKDLKEREQALERNQKRMDAINQKYEQGNYTGTQKADNFIWQHINKGNGHFSLKRFDWAITKSKMSVGQKEYWKTRVAQRLRGLEKLGISKSVDGHNYKIDLEKYAHEKVQIIEKAIQKVSIEEEKSVLFKDLKTISEAKKVLYATRQKNLKELKSLKDIAGFHTLRQEQAIGVHKTFAELEQLRKIETKTKVEIIDSTLLTKGKMNPNLVLEKASALKAMNFNAIFNNVTLQITRLEQLKAKGLVKQEGAVYKLAVSREEFLHYKDSSDAKKQIEKLADKTLPNRAAKKYGHEASKWVNYFTKTSTHSPLAITKPLSVLDKFKKDFRSTYWALKPKSKEERMLAFGVSITLTTAKFSLKLATKVAWKLVSETGRAIYQSQQDLKKVYSMHKTINSLENKKYEYKVKPKSKQREVSNERTR